MGAYYEIDELDQGGWRCYIYDEDGLDIGRGFFSDYDEACEFGQQNTIG